MANIKIDQMAAEIAKGLACLLYTSTGKTTVMRWARQLAPDIHRIKGCLYQCNPESPHCPTHSQSGEIAPDQHEASPCLLYTSRCV